MGFALSHRTIPADSNLRQIRNIVKKPTNKCNYLGTVKMHLILSSVSYETPEILGDVMQGQHKGRRIIMSDFLREMEPLATVKQFSN